MRIQIIWVVLILFAKFFLEDGFGLSVNYPVYLDIISIRLLLSIGYSLYSIVICLS